LLVLRVDARDGAVEEVERLRLELGRAEELALGVRDLREHLARLPVRLVERELRERLLHAGALVVVVVDREATLAAGRAVLAQRARAEAVERRDVRAAGGPEERFHAPLHLVGGLVRERD